MGQMIRIPRYLLLFLCATILQIYPGISPVSADVLAEYVHFESISIDKPTAIALDHDENQYVAVASRNRIQIFNSEGKHARSLQGLDKPVSVAVDALGRIYAGSGNKGSVSVYDQQLDFLHKLGDGNGEFGLPVSIAIAGNGTIYVADAVKNMVTAYLPGGGRSFSFGASGGLSHPVALALNEYGADKEIFVVDLPLTRQGGMFSLPHESARVQVFTMAGAFKRSFGVFGQSTGQMVKPLGICVGNDARVYIADAYRNIIHVFGLSGQFIGVVSDLDHPLRIPLDLAMGKQTSRIFSLSFGSDSMEVFGLAETHTITASARQGGNIDPAGAIAVRHGESLSFSFLPDQGYEVSGITVNGEELSVAGEYIFDLVTVDQSIAVRFARREHAIVASARPGGTITPGGIVTAFEGESPVFLITADTGRHIAEVHVDGLDRTSSLQNNSYSFVNINAGHAIEARFAVDTFTITGNAGPGGSMVPSGTVATEYDTSLDYTFFPEQGHYIHDILVDGNSMGPVPGYSFSSIQADHTVQALFGRNSYQINVVIQGEGEVLPSGETFCFYKENMEFIFNPTAGHHVADVLVDSISMGASDSYTFVAVDADHALTVIFDSDSLPPVAEAGPDQDVAPLLQVTLMGSNSFDPDGAIVSFLWEQVQGGQVEILQADTALASFVSPSVGDAGESLVFRLTVEDSQGKTAQDECFINILSINQPPVADAGSGRTVAAHEQVILDGSGSFDPDGDVLTYLWEQISGTPVQLSDPREKQAAFIAEVGEDGIRFLLFQITVADSKGLKSRAYTIVNIAGTSSPPVAEAGPDQSVYEGENVALNGFLESEVAGIMYRWMQVKGVPVSIPDPQSPQVIFTAPVLEIDKAELEFQLLVSDSAGYSSLDSVLIEVVKPVSSADIVQQHYNPKSKGRWIRVFIELLKDLPLERIDIDQLRLIIINNLHIEKPLSRIGPVEIGDWNRNGIPDLMVKFDRKDLAELLLPGENRVTLSGRLLSGSEFAMSFTVVFED